MFLVDLNFIDLQKVTPELTERHRDYLAEEFDRGSLLFGGRKNPRTGGIIISRHPSIEAVKQVFDADPFVTSGAAEYAITEFFPVLAAKEYMDLVEMT